MARKKNSGGESMRLARYIAQAGIAARRKAEVLIREGHVRVNGDRITDVATNVVSGRDEVTVKGTAIVPEPLFYALLNKPKGCITALTDPWDRPTVMDYLPKLPANVKPVGRLDFYSEGVLLFTNDGELASALLGPSGGLEKTYHVKIRGKVPDSAIKKLRSGVRIGPRTTTKEAQVDRLKAQSKHDWLVITLTEGKSRQIHRMLEALSMTVTKIQRVAFAGIHYHGLRVGDARELTQTEVNGLRQLAGLPKDAAAVARGTWSARREDTELGRRSKARARAEREEAEALRDAAAGRPPREPRSPRSTTDEESRASNRPRGRGKPGGQGGRGKSAGRPSRTSKAGKPAARTGGAGRRGSKARDEKAARPKTGGRRGSSSGRGGPSKGRAGSSRGGRPAKKRR